ncbi:hypothetical protein I3F58_27220 [Streptomyces sp. MUM 203J]|uniref:hypothetical protein n=1 Tax=Streptomyces sp. MUM 203J TaxID=2791990 RepID=UPI001F043A57|nr:hypothetical protein [Streptomyces sp. MUM 203J]MCH0543177.1 hypothetical protein [Streptomyces sp. MUM 203J]
MSEQRRPGTVYLTWLGAPAAIPQPEPNRLRQEAGHQCADCGRELHGIPSIPLPGLEPRRACTGCVPGRAE